MSGIRNPLNLRLLPLTLLVAAGLLTLSLAAAVATRHWVVLPKLEELEAQSDHKDLRRVLLAIDAKKLQLVTLAYQNAIWDGMYNFASKPAGSIFDSQSPGSDFYIRSFFDSSFPLDTLLNFNIDMVVLLDRNNRIIERRVVDDKQASFVDKPIPLAALSPYLIDLTKVSPHAPIFDSGFVATPDGPMMFAIASVMRSDTSSDADANLLFASYFDDEMRNEIQENAQIPITFAALTDNDKAAPSMPIDAVFRDHRDRLNWLLRDNRGKPVLKIVMTLPQRAFAIDLWALPLAVSFITSLLGAIVVLILFQRKLVRPLLSISSYLRAVRKNNDYTRRLDSNLRNELGELSHDIDALVQHVHVQQQQLQAQTREMQALSFQDGLTGLANRRRFDQSLTDNWVRAQRTRTALALIMLDVDYFKNYNDHYGHQRGDEALKQLAAIIRRIVVRQSDIAARYGGEEFAILLPDTSEASAQKIAERIQEELMLASIPHDYSAVSRALTVSIGIAAIIPSPTQSSRELVHQADSALYIAKGSGRNRIVTASQCASA
ncbi:MAG TPA: diguanylate cyclase [Spongiibacteraceae bacterium]|nr:diguanylate cyclase [Spongiibacteraceae bacterium]